MSSKKERYKSLFLLLFAVCFVLTLFESFGGQGVEGVFFFCLQAETRLLGRALGCVVVVVVVVLCSCVLF